jgi:hypothetical protein
MRCRVNVIYLGKRGGGISFANAVYELIPANFEKSIILSAKNHDVHYLNEPILLNGVPSGIIEYILFLLSRKKKKLFRNQVMTKINSNTSINIFAMPHPIDNLFRKLLKGDSKNFIVLHDARRHRGDIWPNRFFYKKLRLGANNECISLSSHVQEQLRKLYGIESFLLPLVMSVFNYSSGESRTKKYELGIFGRSKSYKNINYFLDFLDSSQRTYNVIIQGFAVPNKILRKHHVHWLPNYLDSKSFFELISQTKVVILPYSDASQSGLIPICAQLGTKILAKNVGGLMDQRIYYPVEFVNKDSFDSFGAEIENIIAISDLEYYSSYDPSLAKSEWLRFFENFECL